MALERGKNTFSAFFLKKNFSTTTTKNHLYIVFIIVTIKCEHITYLLRKQNSIGIGAQAKHTHTHTHDANERQGTRETK